MAILLAFVIGFLFGLAVFSWTSIHFPIGPKF